jgi:glycosyltransferase involved in cell wall biosynthesis
VKVLINALGADMGGAVRHLTGFLPKIGQAAPQFDYVVLVRATVPDIPVAENVQLERIADLEAANWFRRLAADTVLVPRRLKRGGFAAIVSLLNFGPVWSPVPHILFQRNSLYYCRHYLQGVQGLNKIEVLMRRRLALASMMRADLIVTPSNAMAKMIQETCPETLMRPFAILRHGYEPASMGIPLEDRLRQRLEATCGVRLLYPTHLAAHKGFGVILDALALLRERGVYATLITTIEKADWPSGFVHYEERIRKLCLHDRVVFFGRVPQGQMGEIYRSCDLMVYPSLCESFGFSMIEAMAACLPIVAAGTAVNREMCSAGALYYDPLDAEQAADCIQVATGSATLRSLKAGANLQMESFDWSWQRYADEFVSLVKSVI